ncbi:MAG TPA: GldG family protein [Thermodesulfobacteriota bacterium]|nr:GldG family protein [Thermodesulfobacteriota bacterium]
MKRRRLIYGTNALVSILSVCGILILVNYIFFKTDVRIDMTDSKLYTVSEHTTAVIDNIDGDIEVIAFFKDVGVDKGEFQDLIKEYTRRSGKIKVRYVNPDKEPGIAKKYDIKEYGTVVMADDEQTIKLRLADHISGGILKSSEEDITNAIFKLNRKVDKTVYFMTGHGERDVNDDIEPEGLGVLRKALEDEGYKVKEFMLLRGDGIPEDNSVLLVAAPKQSFSLKEIGMLKSYLDNGGKAIFLIEPRSGSEIAGLLKGYGFEIRDDIIVDPSSKLEGGGDIAPIVAQYAHHDITEGFRFATIFPYSRSIDIAEEDIDTAVLANTGEYSWSETNFELFDQGVAQQEDNDMAGPLGVAAVVENEDNKSRVAVFGSVDFVSNIFIDFSGNRDLFLNTVNWVSGDENLISIRPKAGQVGKLAITNKQTNVIFFFTVIMIPAVIFFSGIAIWWKRKRL